MPEGAPAPPAPRLSEKLAGELPAHLPPEVPQPTEPDEAFERYARLVRTALGVPVALVSLVSSAGQFFPGAVGLPRFWQQARCTGLSHSFCQHVVVNDAPLVVSDARQDPLLADNRAVEDIGVVAYAGFPLHDADGSAVGSLCAIDTQPREWTERELGMLADLASMAADELALRRSQSDTRAATGAEHTATARLAEVTETMAVGYLSMDYDWRVTYVNTRAIEALGLPREQLVGSVIWELFPATVGTEFEAAYRRAADSRRVVTFDAYYPEPLNAWFEVRAAPEEAGVALYFIDISARHQAQLAVEQASAQISALGRIAMSLAAAENITELVAIMAEQGLGALGADGGSVAVPDPQDAGALLSYITANFGPNTRADFGRLPLTADLPVAAAARSGQRVLLGNHAACAAMSDHVLDANAATGCQAWASIPMRADGSVIGILTAGWAEAQTFPPAQVQLLESFAAQGAQALQRLRSRDAERRAGELARRSAQQQAALVGVAQALGHPHTRTEVMTVIRERGTALLSAARVGVALADIAAVEVAETENGTAHTAADNQASAEVPLRSGAHIFGTLSATLTQARTWTEDEHELLQAMAALTGQALSRIAAHDAEQTALAAAAGIAETLQRSMLTTPPEPDHLQIAVRYAAATDHAEVGGDWYDAFLTADGVTSLVIGDVTGHDMRAAAVMGQLRNLVRGIRYTLGQPPAAVLSAVDRAAAGLGVSTMATVLLAQIEQDQAQRAAGTRLLRWSNAWHPPPLLITANGATSYLEHRSDLMLGVNTTVERHDHAVILPPGATLLLYTDGLIERRHTNLDHGMTWLAQTTSELAEASLETLCDTCSNSSKTTSTTT